MAWIWATVAGGPVVDQASAAAAQAAAAAQLRVETVEQIGALFQVLDRQGAERWPHGPRDVPLVHAPCGEVEVGHFEHLVEQLAERRLGPRRPSSRDIGHHALASRLGFLQRCGVLVAVPITLRGGIAALGDGDLVPERPPADVPSGFPHESYPAVIGAFIGVGGGGDFARTAENAKLARVFAGQLYSGRGGI
jgi:hypothetical protein